MQSLRIALPLLIAVAVAAPTAGAQDDPSGPNDTCYECHTGDDESTMEFACETEVDIVFDKRGLLQSAHGQFSCLACHVGLVPEEHFDVEQGDYADYRRTLADRCAGCHDGSATDVDAALRPKQFLTNHLHAADLEGAPLCTDCHAPHAVARGRVMRRATAQACAECHDEVYAAFAASVHGGALAEEADSGLPVCTDCHDGHGETGRTLAHDNVRLGQPCMRCHGDAALMDRYDLSTRVVSTYLNDFHGVSIRFYGESDDGATLPTLVCADCHGVHDVERLAALPPAEMKARLLNVCRDCHADAAENFPDAWLSHYEPSPTKAPLVWIVKMAYWIFIPFVIGGLLVQIIAHLVVYQRRRRKQGPAAAAHAPGVAGDERRWVVRFSGRQRLEHMLVMLTFIVLLVTGLPQKFSDTGWAVTISNLCGGVDMMRAVHRIAGILFTGLCVLHLTVAIGAVLARRTGMTIVPTRRDFTDAVQNLRHYLGGREAAPRFDRYDYRQKFEYWGMIVGSLVMIVSGFVLYFPMATAEIVPGQIIPAMKAAHTYEAMMALLTIVIWHMYGAHLNPDCFPMDRSIFTGRISLARMKHEHPLEWERDRDRIEVDEDSVADAPGKGDGTVPHPS